LFFLYLNVLKSNTVKIMSEEEKILVEKLSDFRRDLALAYDSSQKFALKKQIKEIEKRLNEIRNLSSTNYEDKQDKQNNMREKQPKSTSEKKISQTTLFASGVGFILLALFLALFVFPCPKPIQYIALRILFTLGGSFLGGFMTGFLEIRTSWLTAAGGLALGIVFYFWNPADIVTTDCTGVSKIKGTVYIENKTQEDVTVKLQQAQRDDKTNTFGVFEMEINQNDLKPKLDFTLIYAQFYIDTVLTIEKDKVDLTDLKFYLSKGQKPVVSDVVETSNGKSTNTNQVTVSSKPKIQTKTLTFVEDLAPCSHCELEIANQTFKTNEKGKVAIPQNLLIPNTDIKIKNTTLLYYGNEKINITY